MKTFYQIVEVMHIRNNAMTTHMSSLYRYIEFHILSYLSYLISHKYLFFNFSIMLTFNQIVSLKFKYIICALFNNVSVLST